MGAQKLFFFCITILLVIGGKAIESASHDDNNPDQASKMLFIFGDSYADTGNNRKSDSGSWKEPYGITFPGKPSGRFSDGRVFTDFLARQLGIKSPIAYKWRKYVTKQVKNGMNFAYGGTGVFDTYAPYPNMTAQIGFFKRLLNESVFTKLDLINSVAHVSLAGNDYVTFLANSGGSLLGLQTFIPKVVNQLAINLEEIYKLGVKKIAVIALQPLGCLPGNTAETSFEICNSTSNQAVMFHNLLLQKAVSNLNKKINGLDDNNNKPFIILDFYTVFSTIILNKGPQQGSVKFEKPLKPCCVGVSEKYSCGDVDEKGNKMYIVCQNPKSYFFWDFVHPTQAGWHAVSFSLQSDLQQLRD